MAKFSKGDVICHPTTQHKKYTVLDEVPDLYGHIVAKDNRGVYCTVLESVFELWRKPVRRFIVEIRPAQPGERVISRVESDWDDFSELFGGMHYGIFENFGSTADLPVIVTEL
jgi:hypothetical protein